MTTPKAMQIRKNTSSSQAVAPARRGGMNRKFRLALAALVFVACAAFAQSGSGSSQPEGVSSGGYTIHQSIEVGYRYMDNTGNANMYDTFVDLHTGPRVLEQTLSMQSQTHVSLLFDNLYVSSMGWGGDPENVARLRLDKNKWYDFRATFRRDQNFFDYNLLDNPLNPVTSTPTVPATDSPHMFMTKRRMSDYDLRLLPQSRITFRLGFSHNNMSGPSYSSVHEGTDALLYQPWNTTLNSYRAGFDLRVAPRTVLSYDHFLDYYKGDTDWTLGSFYSAALASGQSVEFGLPFNTVASQPCATPLLAGGVANPACSGYFDYSRQERTRNSFMTEQLGFRSNYLRRLDLSARFNYSGGDASVPGFSEWFDGLSTRNRVRDSLQTGWVSAKRISASAESAATLHVTDRFRLVDTFRFDNFRLPGAWDLPTTALFGATLLSTPNVFSPATCPPPFTAATCPQHNASSGADVTNDFLNSFLKQDQKTNTTELEYDLAPWISARIGYRFSRRTIARDTADLQLLTFYPSLPNRGACAGLPLDANGVCTTTALSLANDGLQINAHSLLAGFAARPNHALRLSFDAERVWNDNTLTRISPRKELRYRVQTTYTPRPWAVIGGSVNILQNSNADLLTDYRGHSRSVGFNTSLAPRDRFAFDFAYNYSNVLQNALICFNDTPPTGVVLPIVTGAGTCTDTGNPLLTNSYYNSDSHFGMGLLMVKPAKRLTTRFGYSITSVGGKVPQFNALAPEGSLAYNYHQPLAGFSLDLGHRLTWNANWNYYEYGEKSFVGPTDPRYFHTNTGTFSLGYAF